MSRRFAEPAQPGDATEVIDLLPALFRFLDAAPADEPATIRDLIDGLTDVTWHAFGLLQRDPGGAADDPNLAAQAVHLGRAVLGGEQPSAGGTVDLDAVMAWVRYADAVTRNLYGASSSEAVNAAVTLAELLEQRRQFDEALTIRLRVAAAGVTRGYRAAARSLVTYTQALQRAGRCADAAATLAKLWRGWHHRQPADDPDSLHIVMPLVVMLAVCGRTDAALHHLTEAAPHRPNDPLRDLAQVQLRYGIHIATARTQHRPDCTATTGVPQTEIDWQAALHR
ncbi:hypothetical protein ACPPVO_36200 [Dactylosporangium sp. McL0621]|uniref:hypothetical protein n=1 Tax=Dactylosporangium sp. McL0621 TaxID=3415678 RepID=UPI003CF11006